MLLKQNSSSQSICHFCILWPSHISQDLNRLSYALNYSEVKEILLSEYLCACLLFSGPILIFCLYYKNNALNGLFDFSVAAFQILTQVRVLCVTPYQL